MGRTPTQCCGRFQVGNADRLTLVATFESPLAWLLEAWFHVKFWKYRLPGRPGGKPCEWFRFSDEMLSVQPLSEAVLNKLVEGPRPRDALLDAFARGLLV